jgi:uncharacterized protein (TIGR04255 family)
MPHYDRAPITEALIDIRVEAPPGLRFENLETLKQQLSDYPLEETRSLAQGTFQFGPSVQAVATQTPWAIVLRNQNKNQVVQIGIHGFTFSRLAPYETFEQLRDEARRLWNCYREFVKPGRIVRLGLRYINQFNFPGTTVDPDTYLNIYPQLPDSLPEELRNFDHFLLNLRLPQPDLGDGGFLIINEGGAPLAVPETVPFILDLGLVVENPSITDEQQLWAFFDRLRARKNQYFEASITDRARQLISQ